MAVNWIKKHKERQAVKNIFTTSTKMNRWNSWILMRTASINLFGFGKGKNYGSYKDYFTFHFLGVAYSVGRILVDIRKIANDRA